MVELPTVIVSTHEAPLRRRLRDLVEGHGGVESVRMCRTGAETVAALREQERAVSLLDVRLPDLRPTELVAEIDPASMPSTIFLTGFDGSLLRGFEIHALDYLMLPLDETRFQETFSRALGRSRGSSLAAVRRRLARWLAKDEEGSKSKRLPVPAAGRQQFIDLDDVRWVESTGRYARLHLDDRTHVVELGMDELAERFADDFARIHTVLVRSSEIEEIRMADGGDSVVRLRDGRRIHLRPGERPRLELCRGEVDSDGRAG